MSYFSRKPIQGLTLVEVMVGLALGLITILAASSLILVNQKHDRATISSNDLNQDSAFVLTMLDQSIRNAGASVVSSWDLGALGCIPYAQQNATPILPLTETLPVPFNDFLGGSDNYDTLSLAPFLIANDQSPNGSDIFWLTTGSSSGFGIQRTVSGGLYKNGTETALRVDNNLAILPNDLLLLSASDAEDCVITQTASTAITTGEKIALAGSYFSENIGESKSLDAFTKNDTFLSSLGNSADNISNLSLLAVSNDSTLFELDLLRKNSDLIPTALASNIVAMHAVYAIDPDIDESDTPTPTWQSPEGNYAINSIFSQPHKDKAKLLRSIIGVRISVLFRGANRSEEKVTAASVDMLSGLPNITPVTINISDANRHFTHRLLETTIPIKNALIKQPIDTAQYE